MELKLFNGRGSDFLIRGKWTRTDHIFAAARSLADCVRVIQEAGCPINRREIEVYFSKGCWGNTMDGITPDRGVWVVFTNRAGEKPTRLL